jgi:DME family drug/metabolite transporter
LSVNTATGAGTAIAGLMAVGAAAAWGTSTAFSRYALKGTSSLHITAARFGITPIFALMFVFISGSQGSLGSLTSSQWKYIVAITFSTGMVALAIYYSGLKRTLASRAAILELAWPLSAIFVSYIWLHQRFTGTQLLGAAILLGAITMIVRDRKTAVEDKAPKKV